jgi:hypothetical protein
MNKNTDPGFSMDPDLDATFDDKKFYSRKNEEKKHLILRPP